MSLIEANSPELERRLKSAKVKVVDIFNDVIKSTVESVVDDIIVEVVQQAIKDTVKDTIEGGIQTIIKGGDNTLPLCKDIIKVKSVISAFEDDVRHAISCSVKKVVKKIVKVVDGDDHCEDNLKMYVINDLD